MGSLKWYKRDPRAALTGMMELTLEERGAYNTILDLIYVHDGALRDDAKFIAPWLNVRVKTWERLRRRLLDTGKIFVHGGALHNERADDEVQEALARVVQKRISALKRWATFREIKGIADASPLTPTSTKKDLSAKVVPIHKRTTEESGEK